MKFTVSPRQLILFAFFTMTSLYSSSQARVYEAYFESLSPFQPLVGFGGQTICLSVNPSNDNEVLAVTHTGGIMKTTDRGRNWHTLFNLPSHWISYVRHAPVYPQNVIATAVSFEDFDSAGRGGIWISNDYGENWRRPTETGRPAGRVEAYCIATYPGSQTIMVGTNLGLAVSTNNGASFTYQSVPGTVVNAVALLRGDAMVISTSSGIFLWNGFSHTWDQERTGIGMAAQPNSFCVPWQFMDGRETSASPIFVTTSNSQIQFSNNGGMTWSVVDTLPAEVNIYGGGRFFVKAARNYFNDGFDLYCGNNYGMWRKHCIRTAGNFTYRFNERWEEVRLHHSDASDMCIDHANEPYLLATDGGVQRFWRDVFGDNFSFDDGGGTSRNGFHGLEITEVHGTYIESRHNLDLHMATQHNDLWGSENGGRDWPGETGAEGFVVEVPRYARNEEEVLVGYTACSGCSNWLSRRLFHSRQYQITPAAGASSLIYLKNGTYLSFTQTRDFNPAHIPFYSKFYLTENYTQPDVSSTDLRQTLLFNVNYLVPRGVPRISGIPESRIIYQAYKDYHGPYYTDSTLGLDRAWDDTSIQRVKLYRMYINYSVDGRSFTRGHYFPAMRNFGSVGVFPTAFAWYEVFSPDPIYPNHLIAADAVRHQMMESTNGGDDWTPMNLLTGMLTAHGMKFNYGRLTNVSCISFDPDYSQLVMVGTRQSGLYFSYDNGRDWEHIPGSEVIPEISSVYWQNQNTAIVSSYGRGLYKVTFTYRPARVRLQGLFLTPVMTFIHPDVSAALTNFQHQFHSSYDAAFMVTGGEIENLNTSNGIVQGVTVSANASTILYTDDKQYKLPFTTDYWDPTHMKASFEGFDKLATLKQQGFRICGLLLKGGQLVEVIYSKDPLPWPLEEKYQPIPVTADNDLKMEGQRIMVAYSDNMSNGYCMVEPGGRLKLEGTNFPTDLPQPFQVLVDNKPYRYAKAFVPQKDGSFSIDVAVDKLPVGYHTISIFNYTADKKRISESDEFIIMNNDHEEKPDQKKGQQTKQPEQKDEKKPETKKENIIDQIKNKLPVKKDQQQQQPKKE